MPEGVWVDMGKPVPLAEFVEPVRHAVRVHGLTAVLGKHKALILEILSQAQPLVILPYPVFSQKLHGFRWKGPKLPRAGHL